MEYSLPTIRAYDLRHEIPVNSNVFILFRTARKTMVETDFVPFAFWSIITAALVAVTGLVYRSYSRRKNHATSTS